VVMVLPLLMPHLRGKMEFDLAICSHLLFLYSEQLTAKFHISSIKELCRVASEVRVFPLLELGAKTSRHLQTVTDGLTAEGYSVTIVPVPYEFQRGGNQMMKVRGVEQIIGERQGKDTALKSDTSWRNIAALK
jgi:hypothetical protein